MFKSGNIYKYSYSSAGEHHIGQMKDLAERGGGLATCIKQHVKDFMNNSGQRQT
jgi:hypothetical protein